MTKKIINAIVFGMNIEKKLESFLFASRWFMAPFYLGLSLSLILLLYSFLGEFYHFLINIHSLSPNDVILSILSLIDLSLSGNLLLIVVFSGYENFVSKIDIESHKDKFEWRGSVDFSTLKLKLVSSMVAISGIHLLKEFMHLKSVPEFEIKWMLIVHVVFILSGVLLAFMDYLSSLSKKTKKG